MACPGTNKNAFVTYIQTPISACLFNSLHNSVKIMQQSFAYELQRWFNVIFVSLGGVPLSHTHDMLLLSISFWLTNARSTVVNSSAHRLMGSGSLRYLAMPAPPSTAKCLPNPLSRNRFPTESLLRDQPHSTLPRRAHNAGQESQEGEGLVRSGFRASVATGVEVGTWPLWQALLATASSCPKRMCSSLPPQSEQGKQLAGDKGSWLF